MRKIDHVPRTTHPSPNAAHRAAAAHRAVTATRGAASVGSMMGSVRTVRRPAPPPPVRQQRLAPIPRGQHVKPLSRAEQGDVYLHAAGLTRAVHKAAHTVSPAGEALFNWAPHTGAMIRGEEGFSWNVPFEVGMALTGPIRGPRAAIAAARAARAGHDLTITERAAVAARAAQAAHRDAPVTRALGKVVTRRRAHRVAGKVLSSEPSADTLTGKAIEKGSDVMRPVASKLSLGLIKTPERKAMHEYGRQLNRMRKMRESLAHALSKSGLTKEQEYALLVVNEGVDPAQRIAHHVHFGATATSADTASYHAIHASMNERASKYVELAADGRPVLKPDAPKKLHEAQRLYDATSKLREHIYNTMGVLDDATARARIDAPGRVFHGARWVTVEEQIQHALDASPERTALFQHIDKVVEDPAQRNAQKQLIDATLRRHAEQIGDPVAGIQDGLKHLYGLETSAPPVTHIQPHDLPSDIGTLYQDAHKYTLNTLFQHGNFQDAASEARTTWDAMARDVARSLPEEDWPKWVKNSLRDQAVGPDAPVELPNPASPMDQNLGPTDRYKTGGASDQPWYQDYTSRGGTLWQTDPTLEAAAMQARHSSVEEAASMFGVAPGKLQAHIDSGGSDAYQAEAFNNADVPLRGLPPKGSPAPEIRDIAATYMKDAGMPYAPPAEYVKVDPERATRIAQWYDGAVSAPNDPAVIASYKAMADETLTQYHALTDAGYTFEFMPETGDPYSSPWDSARDLKENKHMYVFPTEAGFGKETQTVEHPLLADSGLRWNGKTVTHNDVFRGVHDAMGHVKEGVGFRADGEENAWRQHVAMYSDAAKPAMTSETRGQNSWVNFGPHGEANRTANQGGTVYADQKAVLAPDWVVSEGARDPGLGQRGGALDIPSPYGIKGAISFPDAQGALIHFTEHSDASTIQHEWSHFARRFLLSDRQEARLARALKVPNVGTKEAPQWAWQATHDEQFARMFESFLRNGRSPDPKLTRAFDSVGSALRMIYDDSELPAVNKDVAAVIENLFQYKRKAGGDLIGAEDVHVGVNHVPYHRGVPVAWSEPAKSVQAYFNFLTHGRAEGGGVGSPSLFTRPRGRGSAVGGPTDQALTNAFKGSGLTTGYFKIDFAKAKAQDLITASRLSAAHDARAGLAEIGQQIPETPYDIPVKLDPTKSTSPELRALQERMVAADRDGQVLTEQDLQGIDFGLVEQARQDVFPGTIDGKSAREAAAEAINTREPVDNIVWVNPHVLHESGLFTIPDSTRAYRQGLGKRGLIGAVDGFNNIQRGLILFLSPSYAPVNLAGNLAMNLSQQGLFLPVNLYRAATMFRDVEKVHRIFIDGQMGHGLIGSLSLREKGPVTLALNTMAHGMGVVVDLMPRRAAWLHEARKLGLKKPEDLKQLIDGAMKGESDAQTVVDHISARANDAIVDYERLSPFERNVMSRIIFFYPWIKGATRWSLRFVAEHPVQAAALAMMYEHAQAYANQRMGDRPFYADTSIPIATGALGLKVPGTGIDLSASSLTGGDKQWNTTRQIGGKKVTLPMVENVRQLLTVTTPMEMYQSAYAFATGKDQGNAPDFSSNLTPLPYNLGVAIFGYDPFRHKAVPRTLKTFFQRAYGDVPVVGRLKSINMSAADRAKYQEKALQPRSKGEEISRTFLSGLAPAPYNPKIGNQRVAQTTGTTLSRHQDELVKDSHHFGMGNPPDYVMEELKRKIELDHDLAKNARGGSYIQKLGIAATHYDAAFSGGDGAQWVKYAKTERRARYYYERIRERLYPHYQHWQSLIDSRANREAEKG